MILFLSVGVASAAPLFRGRAGLPCAPAEQRRVAADLGSTDGLPSAQRSPASSTSPVLMCCFSVGDDGQRCVAGKASR